MADRIDTNRLDAAVRNLTKAGVSLPQSVRTANTRAQLTNPHMGRLKGSTFKQGDSHSVKTIEENNRLIRAMGESRRLTNKGRGFDGDSLRLGRTASSSSSGTDVFSAIPRFYDPMEFWDLSGIPWNVADEGHRHKLHKWMRLFYATHYLVPTLIDIYTRFPLVGMELHCKDKKLSKFYEEQFFDELNYPEFLVSLGREYWTVGEAYPLGSFDENMGVWEREELLNPEDIVIENFPLLGSRQLKVAPPDYLKKLAQTKSPAKEYKMLEINFPELIPYLRKNEHFPVSEVLLRQVANTQTDWDDHGSPVLLRGLRTLIHEEKLMASQDAVAERLFSPLILARLGILDLGDGQGPWVPSPDELDAFRDDMDVALSSDFRLLVHHFGLEIENVFGREQMPRLGDDFDRIERRIMQVFGINPSLLSAGSNSQPYASSALQAEFMNQILRTFQGYLKDHFKYRAMVVAEAQEHWDYEVRGQTRIPIMEEYKTYDENGETLIKERHKLLVPELDFAAFDLRDEASERQFLQALRAQGVPIPDDKLMVGIKWPIKELVDEYNDELITKTVSQQEAKMKAYKALDAAGLPIPPDLKAEVEAVLYPGRSPGGLPAMPSGGGGPGGMPPPPGGPGGPAGGPGEKIVMPTPPSGLGGPQLGPTGPGTGPGGAPPISPSPGGPGQVGNGFAPPASFERRPGMPRPSHVSEEPLKIEDQPAKVAPIRTRTEREGDTLHALPRNKSDKKYSFIDPDAEPLDAAESESVGRTPDDD